MGSFLFLLPEQTHTSQMSMQPSNRGNSMPMSAMRKLIPVANRVKEEKGVKIIRLNLGQPDTETPQPFWDAIENYRERKSNQLAYAPSGGVTELVKALSKYYSDCGIPLAENQLIATIGGCEAILIAFQACCDVGDDILVFEPFYSNYSGIAAMSGVTFTAVTTSVDNDYRLPSKAEIEAAIKPTTRAIMYASPGNPTGAVYTREELQMLADICRERKLFLFADEVYREFYYGGQGNSPSIYDINDVDDFVVMCDSFSKRYSACGARVGVVATRNPAVYAALLKVATVRLSGPVLEQVGIAACINQGVDDYLVKVNKLYQERRDILVEKLNKIPGCKCPTPAGAFYAMASFEGIVAEDFCQWVLAEFSVDGYTILISPGTGFYSTPGMGATELRLAYVIDSDDLVRALDILEKGVIEYRRVKASRL